MPSSLSSSGDGCCGEEFDERSSRYDIPSDGPSGRRRPAQGGGSVQTSFVQALGAAAISITHDMASARKIADEIAMLFEGKIIWRGPASKIDDSGNAYVDQFVHGRADGPIQPGL